MDINQVRLHFDFSLNKLGTNAKQNVSLPQFVYLINKAQLHWVESRAKILERDQARVDELQILLKGQTQSGIKQSNFYKVKLPKDYFHPVRAYSTTQCGPIYAKPVEEGNVNTLLQNEFTRPSAEWEETFFTVFNNELRVYVTDFTLGPITLNYIRTPLPVDIAGYQTNGVPSSNIDLEFEGVNAQEIIDLAVQLATSNIGDMERYQTSSQHLQQHN